MEACITTLSPIKTSPDFSLKRRITRVYHLHAAMNASLIKILFNTTNKLTYEMSKQPLH